jgi:hypothetical protein
MRARRFRPSFDTLCQRITPSDVAPVPATAPTMTTCDMPGSTTPLDPGTWAPPSSVLNPTMDPTSWVPANQA